MEEEGKSKKKNTKNLKRQRFSNGLMHNDHGLIHVFHFTVPYENPLQCERKMYCKIFNYLNESQRRQSNKKKKKKKKIS